MAGFYITPEQLATIRRGYEGLKGKVESFKVKISESTAAAVRTMEVSAAAFASGVAVGKAGGPIEVVGVPLDLGLGFGLNILGHLGAAGKHSEHLHGFGDGFLAHWLSVQGRAIGTRWRDTGKILGRGGSQGTSQIPSRPGVRGEIGEGRSGGLSLSDEELRRLAHSI